MTEVKPQPIAHLENPPSTHILSVGMNWFPLSPGGLDRYVYELTQALTLAGDQVTLCGVGLPTAHAAIASDSLRLVNLAKPEAPLGQRLWQTRQTFHQTFVQPLDRSHPLPAIDAINLHFALYALPLLSDLPADRPVTFTFHGPWAMESQQEGANRLAVMLKKWVEKWVFRRCDRFIVLSQAFKTVLHQAYGIPEAQIEVVPGGVDLDRFQPQLSRQAARTQLGWPLDRPILFTPRRLVHRMGVDRLLQALVIVKQQIPDVWLAIAGRGGLRSRLEQQTQALGLTDQVKFLGFLPDEQLPIAYQAADLCVIPSQTLEGFGLVLLEALACGTPACCTPVGGMPEVLQPLSADLISPSTTSAAIADHLQALLTGAIALPSRAACRAYACQFGWSDIAQQVRQILLQPYP